jgi:tripartite-type tricarboxylate transporter receptor subunit TctC
VKKEMLRALALTSNTNSQVLFGVPSIAEAGYPDIAADIWTAVLVPHGTPREIAELLQREIANLIAVPDVKDRMASLGFEPVGNTPDECAAQIAAEISKWSKVIRDAGIEVR